MLHLNGFDLLILLGVKSNLNLWRFKRNASYFLPWSKTDVWHGRTLWHRLALLLLLKLWPPFSHCSLMADRTTWGAYHQPGPPCVEPPLIRVWWRRKSIAEQNKTSLFSRTTIWFGWGLSETHQLWGVSDALLTYTHAIYLLTHSPQDV